MAKTIKTSTKYNLAEVYFIENGFGSKKAFKERVNLYGHNYMCHYYELYIEERDHTPCVDYAESTL